MWLCQAWQLKAGQTTQLDLPSAMAKAGLTNFDGMVNLTFNYSGAPGDVLIATGSTDQSSNYVFEVVPEGVGSSGGKEISYWKLGDGYDTMITLWNPGAEAEDLVLTLYYAEGSGTYLYPVHLEANASTMVSVMELMADQKPDGAGNVVLLGVHQGSAAIASTDGVGAVININLGVGVFNAQAGTCGPPSCTDCSGLTGTGFNPSPFATSVGSNLQLRDYITWNNGSPSDMTNSTTWTSSNGSIATIQTHGQANPGLLNGVGPGGSPIAYSAGYQPVMAHVCSPISCPTTPVQGNPVGGIGPYQVEPLNTNSQGPAAAGSCPNSPYPGFVKYVTNQVQYQGGTAFAFSGLAVADTISIGGTNGLGISGTNQGATPTTGDGSFQDTYFVCSNVCPGSTAETDALQTWTVNGLPLAHSNGLVYKCGSITIDGH